MGLSFSDRLNLLIKSKPGGGEYQNSEIQDVTGISPGYLSQLRHGSVTNPSYNIIKAFCVFFGVEANYFFSDDEEAVHSAVTYLKERDALLQRISSRTAQLSPEGKQALSDMFLEMINHVNRIEEGAVSRQQINKD